MTGQPLHRRKPAPREEPREQRGDGLANALTGLGLGGGKATASYVRRSQRLPASEALALYEGGGVAGRIIDRPADDMVREGFDLQSSEEIDNAAIVDAFDALGGLPAIADLKRWGSLLGAILILDCEDGQDPAEPLDLARVRSVRGFPIYERSEVTAIYESGSATRIEAWRVDALDVAPEDPAEESRERLASRVYHRSRVIQYGGASLPPAEARQSDGWGRCALERPYEAVRSYLTAHGYAEEILHECTLDVFEISGIGGTQNSDQDEAFRRRFRAMQLGKSVLGAVVVPSGDKYQPMVRPAGSLPELLSRIVDRLVADTSMPRSVLLGETPGGLNSGENAGEIRSWYDAVANDRKLTGDLWARRMLELVMAADDGPTAGRVPESWAIAWRPLWQPTEKERAEVEKIEAETDAIRLTSETLSISEVRRARHVEGVRGRILLESIDLYEEPEIEGTATASEEPQAAPEQGGDGDGDGDTAAPEDEPSEAATGGDG